MYCVVFLLYYLLKLRYGWGNSVDFMEDKFFRRVLYIGMRFIWRKFYKEFYDVVLFSVFILKGSVLIVINLKILVDVLFGYYDWFFCSYVIFVFDFICCY